MFKLTRNSSIPRAIDDFMMTDGACPTEGSCSFERGKCMYTNSPGTAFDWLIGSGQTTGDIAPSVDHTTGTSAGVFHCFELFVIAPFCTFLKRPFHHRISDL